MAKHTDYYAETFKNWHKQSGHKPTAELLHQAHGLGCRPGVQALFIAMCLRPEGSTVSQFVLAGSCGPANNKRRELTDAKLIKVTVEGKPYAYKAVLTDKGKAVIAKYDAAIAAGDAEKPAKSAKAKTVKKAVKKPAKAAKPETVTVPVTPDTVAVEVTAIETPQTADNNQPMA